MFYQLVSLRNGSRGNIFLQGRYFWKKTWIIQKPFFQGWVCSIFFSGFDHRVCYQNSKNEPCIYIYIYRVFWKINRDNNQWVGYHQLSAKCSRLAVIIFVYSAGHLLRTENPLLRTNIITLRTENPLLRTHFVIYILF